MSTSVPPTSIPNRVPIAFSALLPRTNSFSCGKNLLCCVSLSKAPVSSTGQQQQVWLTSFGDDGFQRKVVVDMAHHYPPPLNSATNSQGTSQFNNNNNRDSTGSSNSIPVTSSTGTLQSLFMPPSPVQSKPSSDRASPLAAPGSPLFNSDSNVGSVSPSNNSPPNTHSSKFTDLTSFSSSNASTVKTLNFSVSGLTFSQTHLWLHTPTHVNLYPIQTLLLLPVNPKPSQTIHLPSHLSTHSGVFSYSLLSTPPLLTLYTYTDLNSHYTFTRTLPTTKTPPTSLKFHPKIPTLFLQTSQDGSLLLTDCVLGQNIYRAVWSENLFCVWGIGDNCDLLIEHGRGSRLKLWDIAETVKSHYGVESSEDQLPEPSPHQTTHSTVSGRLTLGFKPSNASTTSSPSSSRGGSVNAKTASLKLQSVAKPVCVKTFHTGRVIRQVEWKDSTHFYVTLTSKRSMMSMSECETWLFETGITDTPIEKWSDTGAQVYSLTLSSFLSISPNKIRVEKNQGVKVRKMVPTNLLAMSVGGIATVGTSQEEGTTATVINYKKLNKERETVLKCLTLYKTGEGAFKINAEVAKNEGWHVAHKSWLVLSSLIKVKGSWNAKFYRSVTLIVQNLLSHNHLPTAVAILNCLTDLKEMDQQVVTEVYECWIDILRRFNLLKHATYTVKNCLIDAVSSKSLSSTTANTSCPTCFKQLPPSTRLRACQSCKSRVAICCYCQAPVVGLFELCIGCGHGFHMECASQWFKSENVCPSGCGHVCKRLM
ncbi:hypothetical protein TrST_g4363 [Triparma strigata]|uniref:RING-type domain-containing protein n=1 Tax=Triparma strigata TaxID=1606541 RepID=A0A9W7AIJ7_9STRA|nr:hypothetical protein TrST_g4363 [Triparma strigata]